MLALVFSCCGLRPRPHDLPDERAPLIPHSDDTPTRVPSLPPVCCSRPSSPQPRVIDHQKLKERLGSVVRSKEGKMVNVNAQFPFNLHDHEHPDNDSSRSSRNVSGGTLSSSRAASPSPHRKLHRSPSSASLRPDAQDVIHYLPLVVNHPAPIHSVRLVKSARSTHSIRGRSLRTGDPNSRTPALEIQSESAADEQHTPSHPPTEQPTDLPINSETPPHHPEDFNIHDAGAVARSWGD
ncbi:hypothetical protein OG21DRAFT_1482132 [Imleria badia]|nr:hypothetical protein OG21DRAFT_1482132 [Imleria badia]